MTSSQTLTKAGCWAETRAFVRFGARGLTAILELWPQRAVGEKKRSTAMIAITRIARRVASVVGEMNYAQRRTMELLQGRDGNRR